MKYRRVLQPICVLMVSAALAVGRGGAKAGHAKQEQSMPPVISVRIFNYATLSRKALQESLGQAGSIFRRAGVEIDWVPCRLSETEVMRSGTCVSLLGPAELLLRILPGGPGKPRGFRALGSSVVDPGTSSGNRASVYVDRVTGFARSVDADFSIVIGYAIAHELGHLLLGTIDHASFGIMCAVWSKDAMRLASTGSLNFTHAEAPRLRDEARRRRARQGVEDRATSSGPQSADFGK